MYFLFTEYTYYLKYYIFVQSQPWIVLFKLEEIYIININRLIITHLIKKIRTKNMLLENYLSFISTLYYWNS